MLVDTDLVQGMRNKEEEAFTTCYKQLSPFLYSTILRLLSTPAVSEEVMQESFIQAFNNLHQLDDDKKFVGWIKKIAFNKALNVIRSNKDYSEFDEQNHLGSENSFIETSVENENQLEMLMQALPAQEKLVLWLFVVEGYSHKEIATMVNKTVSYSKSVVHRSLVRMRENYEEHKQA